MHAMNVLECMYISIYIIILIIRNLVSYLKQKEAAGVITLQNPHGDHTGVLYAFPPCQFRLDLTEPN